MRFVDVLKGYFTNKEILRRIGVTLLVLFVFRLLSKVPVPGIEKDALSTIFGTGQNQSVLFSIANILSGGTLAQFSIISLGLVAFISSSVIFQLLGPIVPKIDQLQKMGEVGRKQIDAWTRILTVPIAAIQSYGIYTVLKSASNFVGRPLVEDLSGIRVAALIMSLVAGTMVLMWLAEICSESGLGGRRGGGVSIIITAGILASIPTSLAGSFSNFRSSEYLRNFWVAFGIEWLIFIVFFGLFLLVVRSISFTLRLKAFFWRALFAVLHVFIVLLVPISVWFITRSESQLASRLRAIFATNVARLDALEFRFGFFLALTVQMLAIAVFFDESVRKIPIKFVSRIRSYSQKSLESVSYLPIKVLAVGVMPVVFASSLLSMPEVVYRLFSNNIKNWDGVIRLWGGEFQLIGEGFVKSLYRVLEYASLGWLNQSTSPYYHILHFIFTVLFSLFFITVIMKPEDIVNSLKSRKTFIPGVRPGFEAINYLSRVIMRVTFWGGIILGIVSALPFLLGLYSSQVPLGVESLLAGGTSLFIVVPTILAVRTQINGLLLTKNYEKFEDL